MSITRGATAQMSTAPRAQARERRGAPIPGQRRGTSPATGHPPPASAWLAWRIEPFYMSVRIVSVVAIALAPGVDSSTHARRRDFSRHAGVGGCQ